MKDKEILEKALEKADKNGFKIPILSDMFFDKWINFKNDMDFYCDYILEENLLNFIIFNHDFAKAFFGNFNYSENFEGKEIDYKYGHMYWQIKLKQMVLEKEPLKYLEKFLED